MSIGCSRPATSYPFSEKSCTSVSTMIAMKSHFRSLTSEASLANRPEPTLSNACKHVNGSLIVEILVIWTQLPHPNHCIKTLVWPACSTPARPFCVGCPRGRHFFKGATPPSTPFRLSAGRGDALCPHGIWVGSRTLHCAFFFRYNESPHHGHLLVSNDS